MVKYNEFVIHKYADRLYSRARTLVVSYTLVFAFFGAAGGGVLGMPGYEWIMLVSGGVIFGLIGFVLGTSHAFAIRLRAQIALCQVQIEKNTRPV